jgi:hypothetical protein
MRWKRTGRPMMLNDESRKDARAMAERMIQLHSDQTGWNLALEKKWSYSMYTFKWYFWDEVVFCMKERKFLEKKIAADLEAASKSLKNLTNKV